MLRTVTYKEYIVNAILCCAAEVAKTIAIPCNRKLLDISARCYCPETGLCRFVPDWNTGTNGSEEKGRPEERPFASQM